MVISNKDQIYWYLFGRNKIVTDLDNPLGIIPLPENLILKKGVVGGISVKLSENLDLFMI